MGILLKNELEQRAEAFAVHEHHWLELSGHMAHYDEPEELGRICREFTLGALADQTYSKSS